MSQTTGIFPYDVANLVTGPARILFAAASATLPTALADIFDQFGPTYAPKSGWEDLGATEGASTYNRNLTTQDLRIEQSTSVILEEITGLERVLTVPVAEVRPDLLTIFEAANSAPAHTSAVTGTAGAYEKQLVGTVATLPRYHVAIVVMRDQSAGTVTEPSAHGSLVRGRFFAFVGYTAAISAENSAMQFARNALSTLPLSFRFFPLSGQTQGQEHGYFIDEDSGTF